MSFDPNLAAIRFGTGLSPSVAPPRSVAEMLMVLTGPDRAGADWFIAPYQDAQPTMAALRQSNRDRRAAQGTAREAVAVADYDRLREQVRGAWMADFQAVVARQMSTTDGLRERLVAFWADHFTIRSKNAFSKHMVTPFVEGAIRPHVAGRFADMLTAVTTHPQMLLYLDQINSMGPNSERALRRNQGLNENLARELLELHTIGVSGPYTQIDVREMAELLTGLGFDPDTGMIYRPDYAEPGTETVLGATYSDAAALSTVTQALAGLAVHPATAAHLARKLAVHFVSDTPDQGLVAALTATYSQSGGDLLAVTAVLLDHPAAWEPVKAKVKRPFEFVTSAMRALGMSGAQVMAMEVRDVRRFLIQPLQVMGQPWEEPPGPDGWPEEPDAWITPQGMAGRINWALRVPRDFVTDLPDPRDFVLTALGTTADPNAVFAAGAAENIAEGVAVVLASADFQRR